MHYVFFPEVFLQLQEEIAFHPDLREILESVPANEIELKIGHLASYCEIILDGIYDQEAIEKLCEICLKRLRDKRTIYVN